MPSSRHRHGFIVFFEHETVLQSNTISRPMNDRVRTLLCARVHAGIREDNGRSDFFSFSLVDPIQCARGADGTVRCSLTQFSDAYADAKKRRSTENRRETPLFLLSLLENFFLS